MPEAVLFLFTIHAVEWAGCLLIAAVLVNFYRTYRRLYFLHIAWSWFALSCYFPAVGLSMFAAISGLTPWHPLRLTASTVVLVASYWHLAWLLIGAWELASRKLVSNARIHAILGALVALSLLSLLPFLWSPDAVFGRLLIRFGIRSLVAGLAFVTAGIAMRRVQRGRGLGSLMVSAGFILYGAEHLHYFGIAVWQARYDVYVDYAVFLPFLDFFLLIMIGLGTVVWVLHAERERLLEANQTIDFLTNYDRVTGLANRSLFVERLGFALEQARGERTGIAALVVDIDGFRAFNDSLGRAAGNEILSIVADRLQRNLPAGGTLARTGADEFAYFARGFDDEIDSQMLVESAQAAIRPPLRVRGESLYVTSSIGASVSSGGGTEPSLLLSRAEAALHTAQERGPDSSLFYTASMSALSADRVVFESSLRRAMDENAFVLHYQPIVDLRSSRPVAFEVLVRWQHPDRGLLLPGEFLGVAEGIGLLNHLERWVLETACCQLRIWHEGGAPGLDLAVNISPMSFQGPNIVDHVAEAVTASGISPERLQLEITESLALQPAEVTQTTLRALKELGVKIAIDDFGTGYSSLSHLRNFPVDIIKVDRSFVRHLGSDKEDASIVAAVIGLAHALGIPVVAEGIEKEEQRQILEEHGCDFGQGYLFGRPVPADECSALIETAGGPGQVDKG